MARTAEAGQTPESRSHTASRESAALAMSVVDLASVLVHEGPHPSRARRHARCFMDCLRVERRLSLRNIASHAFSQKEARVGRPTIEASRPSPRGFTRRLGRSRKTLATSRVFL